MQGRRNPLSVRPRLEGKGAVELENSAARKRLGGQGSRAAGACPGVRHREGAAQ